MRSTFAAALVSCLVLAGCAGAEFEEDLDAEAPSPAVRTPPTPASPETPLDDETTEDDLADEEDEIVEEEVVDEEPAEDKEMLASAAAAPSVEATPSKAAPSHDTDRDGIPDSFEQQLASSCTIAGRTCAELGISPPTVGTRDLILAQVGRSGVEQDWRLRPVVWESTKLELTNASIRLQVADLGVRDDINVSDSWKHMANAGKYWVHYVIYDDPGKAEQTGSAGTQLYNLITLAERDSATEERATLLHEIYHALLGDLKAERSRCADEEIGGPGHSDDPNSVLYTSPDCDTNEGKFFRLSAKELAQLRDEPFAALTEMNEAGWFVE